MGELPHRPNDIQGRGVAGADASRVSDDLRRWVGNPYDLRSRTYVGDESDTVVPRSVDYLPRAYPSPWVRVLVFGLFTALAALLVVVVLVALGGCVSVPSASPEAAGRGLLGRTWDTVTGVFTVGSSQSPSFAIVGLLANLCLIAAVLTVVASIYFPVIAPRRAAVTCLALAVGLWSLQWALAEFLGIVVVLAFLTGIVAVAPWVLGWARLSFARAGKHLAEKPGNERAGVAMLAQVDPRVMRNRKQELTNWEVWNKAGKRQTTERVEVTP